MANPLLERAAPGYLARRKQVIEIVDKISTFERLAAIIAEDLGALDAALRPADWQALPVNMRVSFGFADAREQLPLMQGSATAEVPAVCQRCLETCRVPLSVSLKLLLLAEKSTQAVGDDDYEVWELEEATLRPLDVIEEMLVMALPMAAMHADPADCGSLAGYTRNEERADDTVRPFAGLKSRLDETR